MNTTVSPKIQETLKKLLKNERMQKALAYLDAHKGERVAEMKEMVLLHGAPFKEGELRSPMFKEKLAKYGCVDCAIDGADNAYGFIPGTGNGPKILMEAHLDTVFDAATPLAVREEGTRIYCPGIGDDTAAMASVLSVARAIHHANLKPVGTLCLGGTSGEEGEGDLRGIKALLKGQPDIAGHVALEPGEFSNVTKDAVGSRRYEVIFRGPGGHSFSAFGIPSPIHAMGRAIARIGDIRVPENPVTTYTVGVVSGGTSVNSIPFEARMKVDMRSVSPEELGKLEKAMIDHVRKAVEEENAFWNKKDTAITVELKKIGDRDAGLQDNSSPLTQIIFAALQSQGVAPEVAPPSSTNTNAAIGAGVPSVVLRVGDTGNTHNLEEWFDTKDTEIGDKVGLLMLFLMAGLDGVSEPVPLK